MNKKYINLIICFIIFLFGFEIFDHSNIVVNTIYKSASIWFYNIVPTILPIYIISDLLINYNAINYLSKIFGNLMIKLFKIKKSSSFIFLLSIISGFPSNSKFIKVLLDNNTIDTNEANKLLMFTHFSNPLFIIESIGFSFLNNKNIGILILIIHYITNIIIGLFTRNYYVSTYNNQNLNNKKRISFIECLTNSIYSTIKILFLLFGIITIFMLITTIIKENFSLNNIINSIICGILEMTQGIYYVSNLNIPIDLKASLITFFISFGGISIHLQVFSILNDYKLKYSTYLIARIIHGFFASSIVYLILKI